MEHLGILLLCFVMACILAQNKVNGLKCHKCASIIDPKCGNSLELDYDDKDKYVVTCPTGSTACQKIVGEIQGNGDQHIYRQCWEGSNTEQYTPTGCVDDGIRGGVICRCTEDVCNGQNRQIATMSVLVITFLSYIL
ncbi:hypothetical protein ACF0H5_011835 [Mactra antiquata]